MAKNPILAIIISFFFPGLGSVYAGKTMIGLAIFIIAIILSALSTLVFTGVFILYLIVWIYGMYDAYTTAKATEA
jgi:hypothetical protein